MIDTTLLATSEKLWPSACRIFGGPRSSSAQICGEEVFDRGAAVGGAQVAADRSARQCVIVSMWLVWSKRGAQAREPLILHQHQEVRLRQIGGRRGIEAGRAVLDGIEPVAGDGLARAQRDRAEAARGSGP